MGVSLRAPPTSRFFGASELRWSGPWHGAPLHFASNTCIEHPCWHILDTSCSYACLRYLALPGSQFIVLDVSLQHHPVDQDARRTEFILERAQRRCSLHNAVIEAPRSVVSSLVGALSCLSRFFAETHPGRQKIGSDKTTRQPTNLRRILVLR